MYTYLSLYIHICKTSRDHLLIPDSPGLSIDISGILGRRTAVYLEHKVISLSLSLYIYIYMYVCICICIYIYIYMADILRVHGFDSVGILCSRGDIPQNTCTPRGSLTKGSYSELRIDSRSNICFSMASKYVRILCVAQPYCYLQHFAMLSKNKQHKIASCKTEVFLASAMCMCIYIYICQCSHLYYKLIYSNMV